MAIVAEDRRLSGSEPTVKVRVIPNKYRALK